MGVIDKMEEIFDKQLNKLNEKEQAVALKVRSFVMTGYNNWVKPILSAIFMFWLFTKLRNAVGLEDATYYLLIVIIIYLRILSRKL